MKNWLVVVSLFVAFCGCSKKPDTLIESGYDEQEMNEAIARARREVDLFIAELTSPKGTNHAVKAPIEGGRRTEHFWLTDVAFKNGMFEGTINNEPGIAKHVKMGQKWSLKKTDITDWLYMRDGKMHGNYTIRPLLKTMPEDQAAKFRSMLAEP